MRYRWNSSTVCARSFVKWLSLCGAESPLACAQPSLPNVFVCGISSWHNTLFYEHDDGCVLKSWAACRRDAVANQNVEPKLLN